MGLFGANVETLRQSGNVAGLLNRWESKQGRTANRAVEALHELDDTCALALRDELWAVYPARAGLAALRSAPWHTAAAWTLS